jgi:hypothetical protein
MSILVADANLPTVGTEGFFNELEGNILATITSGGTGHYKLTQDSNGVFVSAEAITEIPDEAVLNEIADRYEILGETQNLIYIHFSV